jgi:hypothetical protein
LREVFESEFMKLGCPAASGTNPDLKERAETFAVAVQVRAAHAALPTFLDNASAIERKWLRVIAYFLCFAGAFAYVLG